VKDFNGEILFLDRSDINTDEIIPAKYLTEITKKSLKPHLLEDLNLENFNPKADIQGKRVIVTRENFGCGSSREHAPWALEGNDINLVIAVNFARIFKQNMFNNGMMAIELPEDVIDYLFATFNGTHSTITTDLDKNIFYIQSGDTTKEFNFSLSLFNKSLVEAGGWVNYADIHY